MNVIELGGLIEFKGLEAEHKLAFWSEVNPNSSARLNGVNQRSKRTGLTRASQPLGSPLTFHKIPESYDEDKVTFRNGKGALISSYDEAGESKIGKDGAILGGRVYRCQTFTLPSRGETLWMFAEECSRHLKYPDNGWLFEEKRSLCKEALNEPDKRYLLRDLRCWAGLAQKPSPYVVTARSMFREFGSRIIVDGRRVHDDYWEAEAQKQMALEEELSLTYSTLFHTKEVSGSDVMGPLQSQQDETMSRYPGGVELVGTGGWDTRRSSVHDDDQLEPSELQFSYVSLMLFGDLAESI